MSNFKNKLPQGGSENIGESSLTNLVSSPTDSGGGKNTTESSAMMTHGMGDQASGSRPITGLEDEVFDSTEIVENEANPFKRRESIARTPPMHRRGSVPDVYFGEKALGSGTTAQSTKKRKCEGSPSELIKDEVGHSKILNKLVLKVEQLSKFVQENNNVHKVIKAITVEMESLTTRAVNEARYEGKKHQELEREYKDYQRMTREKIKKLEKQTSENAAQSCTCQNGEPEKVDLSQYTALAKSYTDIENVLKKSWQEQCYTTTEVIRNGAANMDHIVCLTENGRKNEEKSKSKEIDARYPEIKECEETIYTGGTYRQIEQITTFKRNKKLIRKSKSVVSFIVDGSQGQNRNENLYNTIMQLKDIYKEEQEQKILIKPGQEIDVLMIRKMVEMCFFGSQCKIVIELLPQRTAQKVVRPRPEAILIEKGDMSYVDTLRKLKENMIGQEEANSIRSIRKTAKGDLVLTTNNQEKVGVVKNKIKNIMEGQNVRGVGGKRNKTLFIRDIDDICGIQEVKEAILRTEENVKDENLKITSLRSARNGTQTATVNLEEGYAHKLLDKGRLRVGIVECRIQERLDIPRCYKCWSYGHNARNCEGTDRSKKCHICCSEEHDRKNCKATTPYCPLCETEGHQAGSGICKVFKNALKTEREKRRIATNSRSTFSRQT